MRKYLVYTTYPNKTIALEAAEEVVEKGYAACANMIDNITAISKWKGKINREREVVVIFKTTENNYSLLESNLQTSHPYDCPCIVALPIEDGNKAFMEWVDSTTVQ